METEKPNLEIDKQIVAIIPARGGSKGVPRKNVLPIAGKPLICWSIEHAIKSKYITDIVVTTDDEEIKQIASKYEQVTVVDRPDNLATDEINSIPAINHAMRVGKRSRVIVILQPTSPIRSTTLIDRCIEELFNHPNSEVVITGRVDHHMKIGENPICRQQFTGFTYWDGNVWVGYKDTLESNKLYDDIWNTQIVTPTEAESLQIDTPFEFWMVEKVLKEYDYESI